MENFFKSLAIIFGGILMVMLMLSLAGAIILMFSMMVDCFTGYDLIDQLIRPFFQSLGK